MQAQRMIKVWLKLERFLHKEMLEGLRECLTKILIHPS